LKKKELLYLPGRIDKEKLQAAMEPHILAKGSIMGRYKKTGKANNAV
jgi:phosphatidylethanolamine-binding protein (PEBP) family uncharacterized protein